MELVIIVSSILLAVVSAYPFVQTLNDTSSEELSLAQLDKSLTDEILEPKPGNGDKIHQELFKYYNSLYRIFEVINQDLKTDQDVFDLGEEIYKSGGPVFLQKILDGEKMKSVYQWEDDICDDFQNTFSKVKSLWDMVHTCYKNKAWRKEGEEGYENPGVFSKNKMS